MDKSKMHVSPVFIARNIQADHADLIHDVAYDHYGRRLATCSSDQSVKVWDLDEKGSWKLKSSWKSHSGSVWKVTWAHPEFGQILATCSFDRTAVVWEEIVDERNQSYWLKRVTLVDSRTSLTDIRFAPKHLGLMLVTCASDGHMRIYEAPDIMNLTQWTMRDEFDCKMSCSSITWNQSRIHPPMLAVGSDDSNNSAPKVLIYEYNDRVRKWSKIDVVASATDPVYDLTFAPYMGRSYHLLGIASKNVQIVTIKPIQTQYEQQNLNGSQLPQKIEIRTVAQFDDHTGQVWRVSWNITGTILASSGDDGTVRLWKANYLDNWKALGVLNDSPDGQHDESRDDK
ncbi:Nucleoporin SEH1 [Fragariocoptes setiger]|uniref:Nucleoporin SEH1 n=1 Tax=Fragariocoptes setiger TaxID=1670756 RepID=A0ABQ7SBK8_9ACAR|nr:Nucleoporin SEH1 [Fragariocoptes setiger]